MKVGFIGLGTMGTGMASNLQKAQIKLVVHDVRRAAAEKHIADGAEWADNPRALAEQCEVIFTSLPGPVEVEQVALGPDGLLAGMKKGSAYFDLSTNSPTVVRRIEAEFAKKGVFLLDAPVSGGPKGAHSGKLALWIGGDEAAFKKHKRRLQLEQLMLLAVRCLIFAVLGLALARPILEGTTLIEQGGSRTVTIVIDDGPLSITRAGRGPDAAQPRQRR